MVHCDIKASAKGLGYHGSAKEKISGHSTQNFCSSSLRCLQTLDSGFQSLASRSSSEDSITVSFCCLPIQGRQGEQGSESLMTDRSSRIKFFKQIPYAVRVWVLNLVRSRVGRKPASVNTPPDIFPYLNEHRTFPVNFHFEGSERFFFHFD